MPTSPPSVLFPPPPVTDSASLCAALQDLGVASLADVDATVMDRHAWERLSALVSFAPLDALPLHRRTISRATTLGYNQIGQVREAPFDQLVQEFGRIEATDMLKVLIAHGLRAGPTA